jgi:hypothetical protein
MGVQFSFGQDFGRKRGPSMKWYHYLMAFFGGAFTANFVPHFVRGITGSDFPTPFASPPPPVGMSSPVVNVAWALFNLAVGYLLLRFSHATRKEWPGTFVVFVGFAAMSLLLANVFSAIPR